VTQRTLAAYPFGGRWKWPVLDSLTGLTYLRRPPVGP
jgi:hypothetical protein